MSKCSEGSFSILACYIEQFGRDPYIFVGAFETVIWALLAISYIDIVCNNKITILLYTVGLLISNELNPIHIIGHHSNDLLKRAFASS